MQIMGFLLLLSITIDTLMAGISMGINHIRLPILSSLFLTGIGTLLLSISAVFGNLVFSFLPPYVIKLFSITVFWILGLSKIIESLSYHDFEKREFHVKIFQFQMIFQIYHDPCMADMDYSKIISVKESFFLGMALSLDNLALGWNLNSYGISLPLFLLCSFIVGLIMLYSGNIIGNYVSSKRNYKWAWISGIILILLGCFR